jgi:hypothetical protein
MMERGLLAVGVTCLLIAFAPTVGFAAERAGMVLVPADEFWMGRDDGNDDEKPRHRVDLDAYRDRVPLCGRTIVAEDYGGCGLHQRPRVAVAAAVFGESRVVGEGLGPK